ncbi:MAG: DUF4861 family protein [Prevotella sp.]|nr:DUF4861 family protein [Prevotella sp.]
MKRISVLLLLTTLLTVANAQQARLSVTNPSDYQRLEVVEADLQTVNNLLGTNNDEQLIIKNDFGQEQVYQKSYDGKLLMFVSVQPHSTAEYTIVKGKSSSFKSYVFGKLYPERADDITWENDLGIYRVYGPALQRSGEQSFGTDVWVKNIPELVVEERYKMHMWGVGQRDSLKRVGKVKESSEIYLATSFHHDHGYGLDCYSVGPSLGCGAPALMKNGELIFPYCFKDYKILDNGPLRFTVELTYIPNSDGVTEHRLISLDRGSHYNKIRVWYDGIKQPIEWASGVVLNGNGHLELGQDYVLYADPTDNPKVHQSQIYVGVLFPNGIDEAKMQKGKKNHGLGIVRQYSGKPYTYYFGSAWSSYDVRTMTEWQLLANNYLYNIKNPLITEIK